MKFEIFQSSNGNYYWHLKAANGEIVCWGEGYTSFQGAQLAVNWVKANAGSTPVYRLEFNQ